MTNQQTTAPTLEARADYWADWLVDAVAGATQDRRFLRGDPLEDKYVTEAIYLNGKKALQQAMSEGLEMAAKECDRVAGNYADFEDRARKGAGVCAHGIRALKKETV